VDEGPNSSSLKAPSKLNGRQVAGLGPSLDGDLAGFGIDADRNTSWKLATGRTHKRRVAHRRGAEDHAAHTLAQPLGNGGKVADAAAALYGNTDRTHDG